MTKSASSNQSKVLAAAFSRLQRLELQRCFDPANLDSRPTPAQQQVLDDIGRIRHRWVVAGNQTGKSQTGARETAWLFAENHPDWERPSEWGDVPLTMLVVGRVSQQVETELWENKIKRYLPAGDYREVRAGGALQKVIHKHTGNTIIFASHHASNEAREKLQSYVAHYVWLDEMPKDVRLIEELHRRIQARAGYFLATFTPKVRNDNIRRMVEAAEEPIGLMYRFRMFDNPIYTPERQEEILATLSTLSEAQRATILEGAWTLGEEAVYEFDSELHVGDPPGYSYGWQHVEVVDPALKSKLGLTLWAHCPSNGKWYCVKDDYISGIFVPTELIDEVRRRTQGYNIVRRVCDPHEVWYMQQASAMGRPYMGVYKKTQRKRELIKNLQEALGSKILIAPWCERLINEFTTCQWVEGSDQDRMVNSSSYHLLDTAQYFVDTAPRDITYKEPKHWQQVLREGDAVRRQREHLERETRRKSANKGRKLWMIQRRRSAWG